MSLTKPGPTRDQSDTREGHNAAAPLVSVIVPARNEETSIGNCLMSLMAQEGVTLEVIVVDDESTDRTRAIAEFIAGVQVISAGPLPPGWHGKANACQQGANAARGRWLLFTDADTWHHPGSLARAIAEAERHRAALLSYSPEQEVHGFAERAVMPLIFAELAATYRPKDVCNPASTAAAANGQYLLIRREVYDEVGGHAAVARDLLEDVALARLVKQRGHRLRFRLGKGEVRTRMYRSWAQMREGWTKNLVLLFPNAESIALRHIVEFATGPGALAAAAVAAISGKRKLALALGATGVAATLGTMRRTRKAHFDPLSTALSPLGLPLFAYLLGRSVISHNQGSVQWKGRSYDVDERRQVPCPPSDAVAAASVKG